VHGSTWRTRFRQLQDLLLSALLDALCLLLIIGAPHCGRARKPAHKIYTFDLIDPSLLTMRKPKEAPRPPAREAPKKEKGKKKGKSAKSSEADSDAT